MVARFKDSNRIIIVGADRAESLLIKQLVDESKGDGSKKIVLDEFYDIDGEVNGLSIKLVEVQCETVSEEQVEGE